MIIESAASITSDRLQTKEWRIENIKKINPSIASAYLIIADTIKNFEHSTKSKEKSYYRNVVNYSQYIKDGTWHSYIDDILFQSDFINQIEDTVLAEDGVGSSTAKKGLGYEHWIAAVLSYEDNLSILQGNLSIAGGWDYTTFKLIIDGLELGSDYSSIKSISTTCDIPDLPIYKFKNSSYGTEKKGGRPRTDVGIYITFDTGETKLYTVSCKNTNNATVTCFEWFPEHLCDVLDLPYSTYTAIKNFQHYAGITNMSEEEQTVLQEEISPYVELINTFALTGNAPGNPTNASELQIANYILARTNGKVSFESMDKYISRCKDAGYGQVGTILGWTVASAKKRKDGTKPEPKPIFKMKTFK